MSGPTVFVYRLVVSLPEGSSAPGWHPEGWVVEEYEDEDGWHPRAFRWPRKRHCLSLSTANRWARQLRSWGAAVTVQRSDPVAFPEQAT